MDPISIDAQQSQSTDTQRKPRAKIYRSKINNQKITKHKSHERFTWFGDVPTSTGRGEYFLYESEDYKMITRYISPEEQDWENPRSQNPCNLAAESPRAPYGSLPSFFSLPCHLGYPKGVLLPLEIIPDVNPASSQSQPSIPRVKTRLKTRSRTRPSRSVD